MSPSGFDSARNGDAAAENTARPEAAAREVRCAVRFPLALPVVLELESGECVAETCNISASGVLLAVNLRLEPGQPLRFALRMPGPVLGLTQDVLVHCSGRVVRCSKSQPTRLVAATIDEYTFAE